MAAEALLARAEAAVAAADPSSPAITEVNHARERLAASLRSEADSIDADADALADTLLDLV